MEMLILSAIGITALGYVALKVWRGLNGKTVCDCGAGNCKCNPTACEFCRKK